MKGFGISKFGLETESIMERAESQELCQNLAVNVMVNVKSGGHTKCGSTKTCWSY